MPGHRPVRRPGRPLADVHHVLQVPPPVRPRGAARPAHLPPGPQVTRQLPAQRPTALHIQRLVNRLSRHPHLRTVRELQHQPGTDLLRRPVPHQLGLHPFPQLIVDRQLRRPGPPRPLQRLPLRQMRPVHPAHTVPAHLPAHRRNAAPRRQPRRDPPVRQLLRQPHRDLLPLPPRQKPPRPRHRAIPLHPARSNHPPPRRLTPRPRRPRSLLHTQTRTNPVPEHHLHLTRQHRTTQPHHNEPPHGNRCNDQKNPPSQ